MAKDLGNIARTYPVIEHDMLEMITNKLHHMDSTGELKKLQQQFKAQVKDSVLRPRAIPLATTQTAKEHQYDANMERPFA